jgi:tetratricopeptide (TPR) repeat protein
MRTILFIIITVTRFTNFDLIAAQRIEEIDSMNSVAIALISSNRDSALLVADRANKISSKADYKLGQAMANFSMGYIEDQKGKLDKAAIHYFETLRYLDDGNSEKAVYYKITSYKNIGAIFHRHNQFEKAVEYYDMSLDIAYKYDNKKEISSLLYNKAISLKKLSKYDVALEVLFESSKIAESTEEYFRLVKVNQQLGLIFKEIAQYESARNHYSKIFTYQTKIDNFNRYGWSACHNIATTFYLEENYAKAEEFYLRAIDYAEKYRKPSIAFISFMDLGQMYLDESQFDKSELVYKRAENFNLDLSSDPNKFKIYKQLSTLYGFLGDAKKFAEYNTKYTECLEKHLKTSEELAQMDQQYNIQLVTQRYFELVESQKRMAALKKYGGFAVAGILSFILIFLIVSRIRKTRLKKSLEQELKEAMQGLDFDL